VGSDLILKHIEAGNAGFLDAVAGIDDRGCLESFNRFRLDINVDVNDQHGGSSRCKSGVCTHEFQGFAKVVLAQSYRRTGRLLRSPDMNLCSA
jgi:hypothetical protein